MYQTLSVGHVALDDAPDDAEEDAAEDGERQAAEPTERGGGDGGDEDQVEVLELDRRVHRRVEHARERRERRRHHPGSAQHPARVHAAELQQLRALDRRADREAEAPRPEGEREDREHGEGRDDLADLLADDRHRADRPDDTPWDRNGVGGASTWLWPTNRSTTCGRITMRPSAITILAVWFPGGTLEKKAKSRSAPKSGAITRTTITRRHAPVHPVGVQLGVDDRGGVGLGGEGEVEDPGRPIGQDQPDRDQRERAPVRDGEQREAEELPHSPRGYAPGVPGGGATGLLRLAVPVSGKQTQGCAPWLNARTNDEPLTFTSVSQAGDVFPLCAIVQLIGAVTPPARTADVALVLVDRGDDAPSASGSSRRRADRS